MATYKALERGYVDEHIVEEGEIFTTDAKPGKWMEEVVDEKKPTAKSNPQAAE